MLSNYSKTRSEDERRQQMMQKGKERMEEFLGNLERWNQDRDGNRPSIPRPESLRDFKENIQNGVYDALFCPTPLSYQLSQRFEQMCDLAEQLEQMCDLLEENNAPNRKSNILRIVQGIPQKDIPEHYNLEQYTPVIMAMRTDSEKTKAALIKGFVEEAQREIEAYRNGELSIEQLYTTKELMTLLNVLIERWPMSLSPEFLSQAGVSKAMENLFGNEENVEIINRAAPIESKNPHITLAGMFHNKYQFNEVGARKAMQVVGPPVWRGKEISTAGEEHQKHYFALTNRLSKIGYYKGSRSFVPNKYNNKETGEQLVAEMYTAITAPNSVCPNAIDRKLSMVGIMEAAMTSEVTPDIDYGHNKFDIDRYVSSSYLPDSDDEPWSTYAHTKMYVDDKWVENQFKNIPSAAQEKAYLAHIDEHNLPNQKIRPVRPEIVRGLTYRVMKDWYDKIAKMSDYDYKHMSSWDKSELKAPTQKLKALLECLKDKEVRDELREYSPAVYYGLLPKLLSYDRIPPEFQPLAAEYFAEASKYINTDLSDKALNAASQSYEGCEVRIESDKTAEVGEFCRKTFTQCRDTFMERNPDIKIDITGKSDINVDEDPR